MYPNGQIMVNCGGVDFNVETAQEIDGIYENLLSAYYAIKPAVLTNCFFDDVTITPVPVVMRVNSDGDIIINAGVYQLTVTDEDAVTVVNLTA